MKKGIKIMLSEPVVSGILKALYNRRDFMGDMVKIYADEGRFDKVQACITERNEAINLINIFENL